MKINKLHIVALAFLFIVSGCGTFSEGMVGSKRSKSSDEFLIHKKKPLILPPNFDEMPMPKPTSKKKESLDNDIEDLLNLKKINKQNNSLQSQSDKSLENSILKKINKN